MSIDLTNLCSNQRSRKPALDQPVIGRRCVRCAQMSAVLTRHATKRRFCLIAPIQWTPTEKRIGVIPGSLPSRSQKNAIPSRIPGENPNKGIPNFFQSGSTVRAVSPELLPSSVISSLLRSSLPSFVRPPFPLNPLLSRTSSAVEFVAAEGRATPLIAGQPAPSASVE